MFAISLDECVGIGWCPRFASICRTLTWAMWFGPRLGPQMAEPWGTHLVRGTKRAHTLMTFVTRLR
jgi:hypothetical protein